MNPHKRRDPYIENILLQIAKGGKSELQRKVTEATQENPEMTETVRAELLSLLQRYESLEIQEPGYRDQYSLDYSTPFERLTSHHTPSEIIQAAQHIERISDTAYKLTFPFFVDDFKRGRDIPFTTGDQMILTFSEEGVVATPSLSGNSEDEHSWVELDEDSMYFRRSPGMTDQAVLSFLKNPDIHAATHLFKEVWDNRASDDPHHLKNRYKLLGNAAEYMYSALTEGYTQIYMEVQELVGQLQDLRKEVADSTSDEAQVAIQSKIQEKEERRTAFHRAIEFYADKFLYGKPKDAVRMELDYLCRLRQTKETSKYTEELIPGLSFLVGDRQATEELSLVLGYAWGHEPYDGYYDEEIPEDMFASFLKQADGTPFDEEDLLDMSRQLANQISDAYPDYTFVRFKEIRGIDHSGKEPLGISISLHGLAEFSVQNNLDEQEILRNIYSVVRTFLKDKKITFDPSLSDIYSDHR